MEETINNKNRDNSRLVKTLLLIVFIKLILIFVVLKVFFFPDYLDSHFETDEQKSSYVGIRLTEERYFQ